MFLIYHKVYHLRYNLYVLLHCIQNLTSYFVRRKSVHTVYGNMNICLTKSRVYKVKTRSEKNERF